jgi:hypothetical protein
MYALQIGLALAVSMLIFSTLATMVVEIIHKVFRLRRVGLKVMLNRFYNKEVKERMGAMLEKDGAAIEDMPEFYKKVTSMTAGSHTLSTIEFIRRLGETEIGKRIAKRAESEVDDLIDDITERYEDYGRRASLFFRSYSQIGTAIIAVAIALCLNINAVTIFRTFQTNKELTLTMVGRAEQAMAAYQVQAELLKAAAQNRGSDATSIDSDIEDLKKSVKNFKEAVGEVEDLGLPIGWTDNKFFNSVDMEDLSPFYWILTTVFTGFLIGLGGPFWFDMVKRLSGVFQVTGALIRQAPAKETSDNETKPKKGAPSVVSEDPKAAFKLVVRAQRIIDGSGPKGGNFMGPKALRL